MSVLIGIKFDKEIVLAGDKRGSNKQGQKLTDELRKIIPINPNLCFATAGNQAIEQAIMVDIHRMDNIDNMDIEGIINVIQGFYSRVRNAGITTIATLPFCFIVAGKRQDGTSDMIVGQNKQGIIDSKSAPVFLFPPMDCSAEQCNQIFATNLRLHRSMFIEKTIMDIAKISDVVSPNGDIWRYDIFSQVGQLSSF